MIAPWKVSLRRRLRFTSAATILQDRSPSRLDCAERRPSSFCSANGRHADERAEMEQFLALWTREMHLLRISAAAMESESQMRRHASGRKSPARC